MDDQEDPRERKVRKLLGGARPKRLAKPRRKPDVSVVGDANFVVSGDGNTVHHFSAPPVIKRVVKVKTGDGVLTAAQKAKINKAFSDWMRVRRIVRKTDPAVGALRKAFNTAMKVNSYHEILQEDFAKALSWIRRHKGVVMSMKSAAAKVPGWRNMRYKAINARAKEYPDGEARFRAYALKRFGTSSLGELDDKQLEAVYRHVIGWKSRS